MAKRELTLPVDAPATRACLTTACTFVKRSKIDDTLYRRPDGVIARLRRQDTVARLSCTRAGALSDAAETIVLDAQACHKLLALLGFETADRVRFTRDTWRYCQYLVHLDCTETLGDFLTVEAEAGGTSPYAYRRQAMRFLKQFGIASLEPGVDIPEEASYTAPIVPSRSKSFEPEGTP